MSLLELFCHVDDFWQAFALTFHTRLIETGTAPATACQRVEHERGDDAVDSFSSIALPHLKAYYTDYVLLSLRAEFPGLVSYTRFIELMPVSLLPLCAYLETCRGRCTGISFVDSTPLAVCHNRRIEQHRVFAGLAQRGKLNGLVLWLQAACGRQRLRANCWPANLPPAMWMIASRCLTWPKAFLAN